MDEPKSCGLGAFKEGASKGKGPSNPVLEELCPHPLRAPLGQESDANGALGIPEAGAQKAAFSVEKDGRFARGPLSAYLPNGAGKDPGVPLTEASFRRRMNANSQRTVGGLVQRPPPGWVS
jgi:hypothetical protein